MRLKLLWILPALLLAGPASAQVYAVGDTVQDFTLPDLSGQNVSLYDHMGEVIVLNFFATWCVGCNEEADDLENHIWSVYRGRDLSVIAVDVQEPVPLVEGWVAAQDVTYHIWMAPDWNLFQEFPGAINIPYNAVIDRDMVLRYASIGFDLEDITAMVETILAEDGVANEGETWGGVKGSYR